MTNRREVSGETNGRVQGPRKAAEPQASPHRPYTSALCSAPLHGFTLRRSNDNNELAGTGALLEAVRVLVTLLCSHCAAVCALGLVGHGPVALGGRTSPTFRASPSNAPPKIHLDTFQQADNLSASATTVSS